MSCDSPIAESPNLAACLGRLESTINELGVQLARLGDTLSPLIPGDSIEVCAPPGVNDPDVSHYGNVVNGMNVRVGAMIDFLNQLHRRLQV